MNRTIIATIFNAHAHVRQKQPAYDRSFFENAQALGNTTTRPVKRKRNGFISKSAQAHDRQQNPSQQPAANRTRCERYESKTACARMLGKKGETRE